MRDTELFPESDKTNLLTRGVLQINPNSQLYAEVALSRSKTWYIGSGARADGAEIDYKKVPAFAGYTLSPDEDDPDAPVTVGLQMRIDEAGRRATELTSESQRYVVGLTGTANGWDYDVGVNHSVNKVEDRDTHGYPVSYTHLTLPTTPYV